MDDSYNKGYSVLFYSVLKIFVERFIRSKFFGTMKETTEKHNNKCL